MHCGICGDTTVEVRPVYVGEGDPKRIWDGLQKTVDKGDYYACQACTTQLAAHCLASFLITWTGFPCDECGTVSAFDGPVGTCPEGLVCDQCVQPSASFSSFLEDPAERGTWLCFDCFDENHFGHRQKQLQPILDRLANL